MDYILSLQHCPWNLKQILKEVMKIAGFQMLAIQLEEKLHKNLPLGRAAVARLVSHNYSITQTPLGH